MTDQPQSGDAPIDEKLLDRVRKLRAQAESAEKIGSEAEAQAFAALMQRMMIQHKIREADLSAPGEKSKEPIVEQWSSGDIPVSPTKRKHMLKRVEWAEALAGVVALAHYCKIMISTHSARVCFVGRKSDVEVALEIYEMMLVSAAAFGHKEYLIAYAKYRKGEGSWEGGFYRSFLLGFADRLGQRYKEELNAVDRELKLSAAAKRQTQLEGEVTPLASDQSTALVRIAKDSFDAIDEHFELKRAAGHLGSARSISKGVSSFGAYQKGKAAADRIQLRPSKRIEGGKQLS